MTDSSIAGWMAVFITSLGVLFTIGAIFMAVFLYRQSQDYAAKMEQTRRDAAAEFAAQSELLIETIDVRLAEGLLGVKDDAQKAVFEMARNDLSDARKRMVGLRARGVAVSSGQATLVSHEPTAAQMVMEIVRNGWNTRQAYSYFHRLEKQYNKQYTSKFISDLVSLAEKARVRREASHTSPQVNDVDDEHGAD